MHEKVEAFLREQREKDAAQKRAEQRETLLRLGLWEKEYAPEGESDPLHYKETDQDGRRWRKVPVSVSDEEWEEIRRYAGRDRFNKWSAALNVFSGVFYLLAVYTFFHSGGILSLLVWAAGGTLLAAVGKLVDRLDKH